MGIYEYNDLIKYVSGSAEKDMFGYSNSTPVEKYVRYCGGKEVYVPKNNSFGTEHRLIYHCPFEVKVDDKFIIDNMEHIVKQAEKVVDIWGDVPYWRVQVL